MLHPLDTARRQPAVVDAPAVTGLMVEGHRGPLAELSRDPIGARHVTSWRQLLTQPNQDAGVLDVEAVVVIDHDVQAGDQGRPQWGAPR